VIRPITDSDSDLRTCFTLRSCQLYQSGELSEKARAGIFTSMAEVNTAYGSRLFSEFRLAKHLHAPRRWYMSYALPKLLLEAFSHFETTIFPFQIFIFK
jgi:hypothetical protein